MFGFDSRRPTTLPAIDQYISSFASPEAAERDTFDRAPQGMEYLQRQYQAITGDAFADPFEDASAARSKAMIQAAMSGASVATGSNTGMQLLSAPTNVPASITPSPVIRSSVGAQGDASTASAPASFMPTNSEGSPLSPWATREVANESLRTMLTNQAGAFKMGSTEMQIPEPNAGNFLDVLEKRASLAGANEEFRYIQRNNPEALRPISNNDPRFARDPSGKVISEGEMHPLAFDDTFREMLRQKPNKAVALYHAITNRDYKTDEDAKTKSIVEQRDARKKIIEHIKGLEADPITGDLYKTIETNEYGTIRQQRVPLTPLDKAAIEKEGGTKRLYGIDLPGMGGLKLKGATPEETIAYRSRTQALMKEKGLSVAEASNIAHSELYRQQQESSSPVATLQPKRPGIVKAADVMARMFGQTVNAFTDTVVNPIIRGGDLAINQPMRNFGIPLPAAGMIPRIPIPSDLQREEAYTDTPSLMEILKQGNKYWNETLPVSASR